jgi:hypothetical protein
VKDVFGKIVALHITDNVNTRALDVIKNKEGELIDMDVISKGT